jgi:hypothetical protein
MNLRPVNFKRLLLAGLGMVAALAIEAQPSGTNTGKSIVSSSPDPGRTSSNHVSHATAPSLNFQNDFQKASPVPAFDNLSATPPVAPRNEPQFQKRLEHRKDWVFMTPAEILGVTPPEKILQTQERDAASQPKNLTPMERYNERQRTKITRTNDWSFSNNPMPFRNFPGDRNSRMNTAPDNNLFANPSMDSGWPKLSGPPASNPTPQAGMDQFRQLLEPGFSPAAAATLSPGGTTLSKPQALPASGFTQPPVNPAGASFKPLSSGIGNPAGLQPLPGVTRQTNTPPAITPSWAPQPAPWTSQTPQPFAIPKRKF